MRAVLHAILFVAIWPSLDFGLFPTVDCPLDPQKVKLIA